MQTGTSYAHFSIPSILAVIAAVASFGTGAFWGFILAIVAIICGLLGLMLSFAPSVRGGFVSIFSLFVGAIAIVVALVKAVGSAF